MPNFKTHIISGIIAFPLFFLIFNLIHSYFFYDIYYVPSEIFSSFLLFVLGSDFPDVDHHNAFINKFFRLFLVIGSVYYIFDYKQIFIEQFNLSYNISSFLIIVVGILIGMILGFIFNKLTKHRGMWHSIITGVVISVLIYFLNFKYRSPINLFYSLNFFVGFSLHLLLDKVHKN